jgi:hypothetical protein
MTENKQQRRILIASFSAVSAAAEISSALEKSSWNSRAQFSAFRTQKSRGSRGATSLSPQLLHRIIHTLHNAPVDITVDKRTPPTSEKAQQNQHFKYHRTVLYSYAVANKSLTALWKPEPAPPQRAAPIVTPIWNMHRSRAACSLNVTSIGICLSRQQYVFAAISHFSSQNMLPPLTHPECGTIVKRPLECSRPTSQGFFRGLHESA